MEESNKNKEIKDIKATKEKIDKEILDRYFSVKPKTSLTMGMEVEMFLWDMEEGQLFTNEDMLADIMKQLPIEITRDYCPYQLEIRTKPHNNPNDLIKDFVDSLKLCRSVFIKENIKIIPLSWLGSQENMCGVHFHIRNGNNTKFENIMFNSYPFILTLTDCFKNSYRNEDILSFRFMNSQHISLPNIKCFSRSNRFSDIAINRNRENNRHRLKSQNTVEIRTFDVPYDIEYMANLVHLIFNLYNYIVSKEKVIIYDNKRELDYYRKIEELFLKTRNNLMNNSQGHNFYFGINNQDIYDYLCDKFNIPKLVVPCFKSIPISKRSDKKRKVSEFLKEIRDDKPEDNKNERPSKEIIQHCSWIDRTQAVEGATRGNNRTIIMDDGQGLTYA